MKTIEIKCEIFESDKIFHNEFSKIMGFIDGYGNNWDAWIDCMSYLPYPEEKMSKITLVQNENLEIQILVHGILTYFKTSTWEHFTASIAAVNGRFAQANIANRIIITEKHHF